MDPASSTQPQKSYPCNSPENPRRSTPLSINVEQPIKVKLALLALSEADFNPTGQGRVDIGQDGFKITVWNPRTLVVGNLRLLAQADHDFLGGTSFSPKKIDLKSLVEVFDAPRDDEDVTVSVVHGSDKLSFTFGRSDQPTKILVDLSELSAEFRESPVITAPCGAIMASQYLRETMIPDILFQQGTPQDVTVKMTENSMNMTLGDREWHSEIGLTRGWKPEEGFSRTLKLAHLELLMGTSKLTDTFELCFLDYPHDSFLLHFSVTEGCDLRYIRYGTCFSMKLASHTLKEDIGYLCDFKQDNPKLFGIMDVDAEGLLIKVPDSSIRIKPNSCSYFVCTKPVKRLLKLKHVLRALEPVENDKPLVLYYSDGSDELVFTCGDYLTITLPTFAQDTDDLSDDSNVSSSSDESDVSSSNDSESDSDVDATDDYYGDDYGYAGRRSQYDYDDNYVHGDDIANDDQTDIAFSFGIKPAKIMKSAIEALADSEFNPKGLARIDVDASGFKITVRNSRVTGYLQLVATGLIDFKCTESVLVKTDLEFFSYSLNAIDDEDTVTIYLLAGSTELTVRFEMSPTRDFRLAFEEPAKDWNRIPDIIMSCQAANPSQMLREIIEACQQEETQPQQVEVSLTKGTALFTIQGTCKSWRSNGRVYVSTGIEEEGQSCAFDCNFCNSLKKASLVSKAFIVCLLETPSYGIKLRFHLRGFGDLEYVMVDRSIIPIYKLMVDEEDRDCVEWEGKIRKSVCRDWESLAVSIYEVFSECTGERDPAFVPNPNTCWPGCDVEFCDAAGSPRYVWESHSFDRVIDDIEGIKIRDEVDETV